MGDNNELEASRQDDNQGTPTATRGNAGNANGDSNSIRGTNPENTGENSETDRTSENGESNDRNPVGGKYRNYYSFGDGDTSRRKPGRPRKEEKISEADSLPETTIVVSEELPAKKRGRKKKVNLEEYQNSAQIIISLFDGLAITTIGPGAEFNPMEKAIITPPITRMIARLSPETMERVSKFSDPLILLFGLGLWGKRVFVPKEEPETKKAEFTKTPEPVTPDTSYSNSKITEAFPI